MMLGHLLADGLQLKKFSQGASRQVHVSSANDHSYVDVSSLRARYVQS